MLTKQDIQAAAHRGWWVGTVIDEDGPHLAVLGTTPRFCADKINREVLSFARVEDELAIKVLAAVMQDNTRNAI